MATACEPHALPAAGWRYPRAAGWRSDQVSMVSPLTDPSSSPKRPLVVARLRHLWGVCARWVRARGPLGARLLLLAYAAQHVGLLALARRGSWAESERWAQALRWPVPALLFGFYGPALWFCLRGLVRRQTALGRWAWAASLVFALIHGGGRLYARVTSPVPSADALVHLHSTASSVGEFGVPWNALGWVCGASSLFVAVIYDAANDRNGALVRRAQWTAALVLIVLAALTVVSYATGG